MTFLPIIDMSSSNYTCIHSTLLYIKEQCQKFNIQTASVTFDQPLWLKATEIVTEKSLDIVVHLGGFHTLMSFVGSIGSLMDGSGLREILHSVYGENTVKHILSGKAIARAIRGHILVESALNFKLQEILVKDSMCDILNGHMTADEWVELEKAAMSTEDISTLPVVRKLCDLIEVLKTTLSSKSRTAKLWLLYLE